MVNIFKIKIIMYPINKANKITPQLHVSTAYPEYL